MRIQSRRSSCTAIAADRYSCISVESSSDRTMRSMNCCWSAGAVARSCSSSARRSTSSCGVAAGSGTIFGRRVVGEPEAVFEQAKHEVLPAIDLDRIGWACTDPGLVLRDVVEESVVGDAGDGVVPHGCCCRSGGS